MALSALVLAALLSACGGGGSTGTGTGEEGSAAAVPTTAAVVKMTTARAPARVIVDADGMTVYEFRRDDPMLYQFDRDPVPTCYKACAVIWSPLLTADSPKAAAGADPSMLGTIERKDGSLQVTYADHPLYVFAGDKRPGEMNGQDIRSFGARWHAVQGDGSPLSS